MKMKAGAVLFLLVCLVAVIQGAEVLLNPEMDGCVSGQSKPVTSWTGGAGSNSNSDFVNSNNIAPASVPQGDSCFAQLFSFSFSSFDKLTQTINVPSDGNYDFSGLVACYLSGSTSASCGFVLTIDSNNIPLTGTPVAAAYLTTYLPISASAIPLTAGSHSLVFTMTYPYEGSVNAFITKLSLVPSAGGSGDPHMVGFQGQQFDYIGRPGQVVNLLTDSELQVNTMLGLQKRSETMYLDGPVMMEMAFMTRGHTVIVNAGGYQKDQIGFVSVDGVLLPLGQSFLDDILSVAFTSFSSNSQDLGFTGNDHIVAQVDVKLEGMYEFRVFMIENGKDNLHHTKWVTNYPRRFLDFNASLLDLDRRPHGVLGQTAAPLGKERSVNEWTIEGKDEDYVVKDGLTGTQFSFNLFL